MNNKLIISQFFKRLCVISACFLLYSVSFAETGVTLNLKDADIRSFIETVAEATERNFVVDPRVKAKVTVISARPMNREEVYQVFISVLQVHGYAAVQVGQIIKILPDVNAKQGPVATAGERSQGIGDELVTRVVHIKHVPAAQMVLGGCDRGPSADRLAVAAHGGRAVAWRRNLDANSARGCPPGGHGRQLSSVRAGR